MTAVTSSVDLQLAEEVGKYYDNPAGFVLFAFPWGEKGALAQYKGPDRWQTEVLNEIAAEVRKRGFDGVNAVAAIREAISSGHGIGKSTLVAWIVCWIMSTRPNCQGTVTANTFSQLETKTWAAIQKWMKLCITSHWFTIGSDRVYRNGQRESWFVAAQSCKEENSESFAGQHAASSTSFYIFDEASAIPDKIWEVAEGGLTDGEPMIFAFGNPTRNQGKFHRVTFGSERGRWLNRSIDSRDAAMTNKAQIAEWVQDYGEDSDFVRVRVRGLPPSASDLQFIDSARVYAAQKRPETSFPDDPLILGLDLSRGGTDDCVFRFRKGFDARSIATVKIPGEQSRDTMAVVSKFTQIMESTHNGDKITIAFVDVGLIGGAVVNRMVQLGYKNVVEINFGGVSPDRHYANMRAYMWAKMRDWLESGAIDGTPDLEVDLTGPGFKHNKQDSILLESKEEMKKRGLDSPDDGDALALTFAQAIGPARVKPIIPVRPINPSVRSISWMR